MKTQRNILVAFLLNLGFSVFELLGGIFTGSVAIISDAMHDFGDAISIGASWILEKKSKEKPDNSYTYGYARYSVLGAVITNLILLVGSAVVIYNAVLRLIQPNPIRADGMILMAVLGACMNLAAAWFTHGGHSLNEKAVNLHMLEDVLGWLTVLLGGIVIRFTNWVWIDPVMSIGVAVFIILHAGGGFWEAMQIFLEKAPADVDHGELLEHLQSIPRVAEVHHLHIWSMDGTAHYATVHVVAVACDRHALKQLIRREFAGHGIVHVTIELEEIGEFCEMKQCKVPQVCSRAHGHHHHH